MLSCFWKMYWRSLQKYICNGSCSAIICSACENEILFWGLHDSGHYNGKKKTFQDKWGLNGNLWMSLMWKKRDSIVAQGHLVCDTGQMFLLCFLYVTQRCGPIPLVAAPWNPMVLPLETPWCCPSKPHGAVPRNPCAAPRNPMVLCLETPGAPRLKTPGDKIWDQNFQVLVVFRPLRPNRAIPLPITIQNMKFRR